MFDLSKIDVICREERGSSYSFVGMKANSTTGKTEFWLPLGFEQFPKDSFDDVTSFFFQMYRTFCKFEESNRPSSDDTKPMEKDQVARENKGYTFINKNGEACLLYSKLHKIQSILDGFDELAITSILFKSGRSETVDYSKIHQYLHKAVFLDNDTIFIDEMNHSRKELHYDSTDLIEMFCFIYHELKQQLNEIDNVPENARTFARKFREDHLSSLHSLFNEHTFQETISILRETLNLIDKNTFYKDGDYWHFYEAVENFLYGELVFSQEDGSYWGIDNFWAIWEDMCHTYVFVNFQKGVIYADTNIVLNGEHVGNKCLNGKHWYYLKDKDENYNPFYLCSEDKKRWLRPDMVRLKPQKIEDDNTPNDRIYPNYKIRVRMEEESDTNYKNIRVSLIEQKPTKNQKQAYNSLRKKLAYKIHHGYIVKDTPKDKLTDAYSECRFKKFNRDVFNSIIRKELDSKSKDNDILILDFKYHSLMDFTSNHISEKITIDITKQLVYEYAVQSAFPEQLTESQFVIPWFYSTNYIYQDDEQIGEFEKVVNDIVQESKMKVFRANFSRIQQVYLEEVFLW